MSIEKTIKEKEIAELVLEIDNLREEKKNAIADYKEQLDALQKKVLAAANEINASQLSLGI